MGTGSNASFEHQDIITYEHKECPSLGLNHHSFFKESRFLGGLSIILLDDVGST